VRGEPGAAARLLARKLGLFLSDWEFGNPEEPTFFAARFAPVSRFLPFGFGMALALAVVGLWTSRRGAWARFPLWGFLVVYAGSIVLFLVSARYREPLLPVLFLYSACGAVALARWAIAGAWTKVAVGLLVAGAVFTGTKLGEKQPEQSKAYGLDWLARAANRDGRKDEAILLYRQALETLPDAGDIRTGYGLTLASAKLYPEAVAELERGVELTPYSVYALDSLAQVYLQTGQPAKAGPIAERSIRIAPHLPNAYYYLGRAKIAEQSAFAAEEAFQKALERKPTTSTPPMRSPW
jgi:tetratricopeptide (TPR) repeat protein